MATPTDWFKAKFPNSKGKVAYFCAEFGLNDKLPIYSGGLGVLAGDHLKEASDLDLPLVAVGLYYKEGYFTQKINRSGQQLAEFIPNDPKKLPIIEVKDLKGNPVIVSVEMGDRTVYAGVYKNLVGRISLYLLNTDIEQNNEKDRNITNRLYCSDRTQRLEQEVLLGIGGWKLLQVLGEDIRYLHLNEGHCVFAALEWTRQKMDEQHLSFEEARAQVRASTLFTTHTPVPAGNEAFDDKATAEMVPGFIKSLGLDTESFLNLGRKTPEAKGEFSLSIAALNFSNYSNGVSKLHGHVSRGMWQDLFPGKAQDDVPIGHITNGVHYGTWVADGLKKLCSEAAGSDIEKSLDDSAVIQADKISDEALWNLHTQLKSELVTELRRGRETWLKREGFPQRLIDSNKTFFNPNALTIGFARRFATYKRATLIFSDLDRLQAILKKADRPVQIVFAGRSHPADLEGQKFIQNIVELSLSDNLLGSIYLAEGYNMSLAAKLVQGVDVWLNNPHKPLEASGTSGQKAAINGAPNLSVLDGWWDEGFAKNNGWGIEESESDTDETIANRLYECLEDEVIPEFYDNRHNGIPQAWVKKMKNSISSITPMFTTRRMLKEYCTKYYGPGLT
jgi:glycogen phosphorylase